MMKPGGITLKINLAREICTLSMFPTFNALALLSFPYIEFSILTRSAGFFSVQLVANAVFFDLLVSSLVSGVPSSVRTRVGGRFITRGHEEISELFWGSLLLAIPALLVSLAVEMIIPSFAIWLESNVAMADALKVYMKISVFSLPFSVIQSCATAYLVGQKKTRFRIISAFILQTAYIGAILILFRGGQRLSFSLAAEIIGKASLVSSVVGAFSMTAISFFMTRPRKIHYFTILKTALSLVPQSLHGSMMQIVLTVSTVAVLRCGTILAYPGSLLFSLFLRYARDLCSLGRGVGEGLSIFVSNRKVQQLESDVRIAPYVSSAIVTFLLALIIPLLVLMLQNLVVVGVPNQLQADMPKYIPAFFLGVALDCSTICFLYAMQGMKKNQVALRASVFGQLVISVPMTYLLCYIIKPNFLDFFYCFVAQKILFFICVAYLWHKINPKHIWADTINVHA
ncbi:hypothetical protein [Paraburkholderia tropica]|uniref:hypothetical protein n=1 Tax=Paraburkholderia tropica TaxID=92647 RepID=UPI001F32FBBA|nr:hypothetical protein [Paraburkholderia tropica]